MSLSFPYGLLESGLVLGHTTDSSARVWLRCQQRAPHQLLVTSEREGVRTVPVLPDGARDQTALVTLSGLTPDERYRLDLQDAQGRSVLPEGFAPSVRAAPRALARLCFGVMSCSLPFERSGRGLRPAVHERVYDEMFDALVARDARFVVNLGDQLYADELPEINLWNRMHDVADGAHAAEARRLFFEAYRGFWAVPGVQRLRARFPHYMIWDDHEIRDDWGSRPARRGRAGRIEAAMWGAAREAYDVYQHALNPAQEGVHHYAFELGKSAYFVLDLRGQRSATRGQLLGERQWHDLERWLTDTATADVRFLVSSVPPHHAPERWITPATRLLGGGLAANLLPSTFYDRWCAAPFAAELARLMALLLAPPKGSAPVVVLAGDIHIGAAMELGGGTHATVHQWITSAVTTTSPAILRIVSGLVCRATNLATGWPVRHHFEELRNNFGIVEIDAESKRPEALFHLYAWNGKKAALAHTVRCNLRGSQCAP